MGANSSGLSKAVAGVAASGAGNRDYNELTRVFLREIGHRTRDGVGPECLFLDIEESGQTVWASTVLGNATRKVNRETCRCFGEASCRNTMRNGSARCRILPAALPAAAPDEDDEAGAAIDGGRFDLVISCHSISFIDNHRAVCFLERLRQSVRSGGMLFISALGKYSALADHYPAEEYPLAERFFPLTGGRGNGLAEGTRVCLYSERDLCTTLFEAGWSVVRSSTTTENNVLATAVRI